MNYSIRQKEVIQTLLADPYAVELIRKIAKKEKKSEDFVWNQAKSILQEMSADPSQRIVGWSYLGFRLLWKQLFTTRYIEPVGLREFVEISKKAPVLLLPSHRSHIDYLLLSAIFYENGLPTPHIAAGINLSFWPMGPIFRKNGAFFIRRHFTTNLLYARMLFLYIKLLMKNNQCQEFYIEGGRTRTGKLSLPKHGLLSLEIDAFLENEGKDLYIVPASITYDRVPEDVSYKNELLGGTKEKESAWLLWKARKLLKRKYGGAYVQFGKPISLTSFRASLPNTKLLVHELTEKVAKEITQNTPPSLSAIAALTLLSMNPPNLLDDTFDSYFLQFLRFIRNEKKPLAPIFDDESLATKEAKKFIASHRLEQQRHILGFYKNTVLHAFLPVALRSWEATGLKSDSLVSIMAHEFPGANFNENTNYEPAKTNATLFRNTILSFVEIYFHVAKKLYESNRPKSMIDSAFTTWILEVENPRYPEAFTTLNIRSAYAFFYENNIIGDANVLSGCVKDLNAILNYDRGVL